MSQDAREYEEMKRVSELFARPDFEPFKEFFDSQQAEYVNPFLSQYLEIEKLKKEIAELKSKLDLANRKLAVPVNNTSFSKQFKNSLKRKNENTNS